MQNRILSGLAAVAVGAGAGLIMGAGTANAADARPFLYVSATAPGTVSYVDPVAGREVNTIQAGGGAGDVAYVPAWDTVLAANENGNEVAAFDSRISLNFVTFKVGAQPHGVAAGGGIERIYVANYGDGTVSVVSAEDTGKVTTVAVGTQPHGIAVSPDERQVYVTTADAVVVLDTATNAIAARIPVVRPYGVAFAPDGAHAYVTGWTSDTVSVIDTATRAVAVTVPVGNRPYDVAVAPDGRHAYVSNWGTGTVSVLDTASNTVTAAVPVAGGHPYGLDVTADGRSVYAAGGGADGTVTPINTATNAAGTAIRLGHPVTNLAAAPIVPVPARASLAVAAEGSGYGPTVKATATPALSTARITGYSFDFGDGTVVAGTEAVVRHTYAHGGTYTVKVISTDAGGATATTTAPVTVAIRTRTLALMARSNARYVSAEAAGNQPLVANRAVPGVWEQYDLLDVGDGNVELLSHANNGVVGVDYAGRLITPIGGIGNPAADFQIVPGADGTFALRSRYNGKYVSGNNGTGPLTADRAAIGPWEQFYGTLNGAGGQTITANVNHRFVTAEAGGNQPLIANRGAAGPWETFDVIDAGDGTVALFSHADARFVTAENGGNSALVANRTAIGPWERFTLSQNPDGSTSLRAGANGKYVTAEAGGNQPLIANRTAAGAWESFSGLS